MATFVGDNNSHTCLYLLALTISGDATQDNFYWPRYIIKAIPRRDIMLNFTNGNTGLVIDCTGNTC